uniref:Zinc finger containing preotein n=1 Tax=Solanum tuberosum TaxID=4113 RepID=M1DWJ9_SOLTU
MEKYKIKHSFNFRVKRSDSKRPVAVVDASHLSGSYRRTFVSASTLDGAVYEGAIRYIVCLERKTCSCGRFQHDEIPCAHSMAVLKKKKNIKDAHPYCSDYYKHDALTNTYALPIEPMPDKSDWIALESVLEEVVLPPRYKKMSGRPRKKRKKNPDEKITTNTNCCGQCGQEGHNRRTCTFFPKDA